MVRSRARVARGDVAGRETQVLGFGHVQVARVRDGYLDAGSGFVLCTGSLHASIKILGFPKSPER